MNRLAQIEEALRDLAAAFKDENWDAMAAVPLFDPDASDESVDLDTATKLLSKVNGLLAVLSAEADSVRTQLNDQPRIRRATRAYLSAEAASPSQR